MFVVKPLRYWRGFSTFLCSSVLAAAPLATERSVCANKADQGHRGVRGEGEQGGNYTTHFISQNTIQPKSFL